MIIFRIYHVQFILKWLFMNCIFYKFKHLLNKTFINGLRKIDEVQK